jgi:hypothetical protein
VEKHSSCGFLVFELVIHGIITILLEGSSFLSYCFPEELPLYSVTGNGHIHGNYFAGGFLALEIVIPGRITRYNKILTLHMGKMFFYDFFIFVMPIDNSF